MIRVKKERMKGIGLILLMIYLSALPDLFAQQENVNSVEGNNAAVYYSRALDLLKYPESEELKNRTQEVIKNGWQEEDKELEKVLGENESSFDEFLKGLLLEKCDFNFGKEYKYLLDKELPPLAKIRNLSNLLLLKGRYYEKQKEFDKAVNVYLSSLTFARHISQDNTIISKMIALAIEKNTYAPLEDYLNSKEINQREHQKILDYIEDYKKQHFPARELVEHEKDVFISTMKMLADGVYKRINEEKLDNKDEKIKAAETFTNEFMKQANELADKYYGNFVKAVETNKENDWEFAASEFESFIEETKSTAGNIKDVGSILHDSITKDVEGYNEKVARRVVSLTLGVAMPDFKKAAVTYYSTLEKLKSLTEMKANE